MSNRRYSNRRLRVENLESRAMMSASPVAATVPNLGAAPSTVTAASIAPPQDDYYDLLPQEVGELNSLAAKEDPRYKNASKPPLPQPEGSTLVIHGCAGDDKVEVKTTNGRKGYVTVVHHLGDNRAPEYTRDYTGVTKIGFIAYDGNNTFTVSLTGKVALPTKALGGANKDVFKGNDGDNVFFGRGGDDKLHGGFGSDKLYGGRGNDKLEGRTTKNCQLEMRGGPGVDTLIVDGHALIGVDKYSSPNGKKRLSASAFDAALAKETVWVV